MIGEDNIQNLIQKKLLGWAKGGYNDVVLPNFFYGYNECDVFKITGNDYVVEYEIKISRNDFFADLKKTNREGLKHDGLSAGTGPYCPNRFFYVVPENLVAVEEVPPYAGLLYFDGIAFFTVVRNARMLHKRKADLATYRDVCRTLAVKCNEQRNRIIKLRNVEFDKEMNAKTREIEQLKKENKQYSGEQFILRTAMRRVKEGKVQEGTDLYYNFIKNER